VWRRCLRWRADARAALHEALASYERRRGAVGRAGRAELRATGVMPPPDNAGGLGSLTSQELQVALIVA